VELNTSPMWEKIEIMALIANENPLPKEPPRKDPPRKDPEPKDTVVETIRNYFPETWVWDLVTVK